MELSELAVKKALSAGATEVEAYTQKRRTIQVEFSEKIENFKVIDSTGLGLRVSVGKRVALYSTSILDGGEVSEAAAKAVKIAGVAPEDPHWRYMNRKFGRAPAEGYYDKTLEALSYDEIVEAATSSISAVEAFDRRVKLTRGLLTIQILNTSITNGYGQSCERAETYTTIWMTVKADEAGMESTGTEHREVRFWKEVDFEGLAIKAAERAVKFLKAKPVPSGKMPVIIRNQMFADVLGVMLSGPISANWVQEGRSPLSNKLNAQIASENVEVVDDGLMSGGLRTRPFDDEGHPTQRTQIVEKGTLKSYVYDTYTALKDNVESTGNASRFYYWVSPAPSPSNLILKPGRADLGEMISETKRGIYVEEIIGEWLSNPVSGGLSATVTHGFLIEGGELKEPIKGVIISGNFYELLKGGLEMIGNDTLNSRSNYSPTVKLVELTVAGK